MNLNLNLIALKRNESKKVPGGEQLSRIPGEMHPAFTARYTVLRKLGEGGQATVYQCRPREGDLTNVPVAQEVAVKVARES